MLIQLTVLALFLGLIEAQRSRYLYQTEDNYGQNNDNEPEDKDGFDDVSTSSRRARVTAHVRAFRPQSLTCQSDTDCSGVGTCLQGICFCPPGAVGSRCDTWLFNERALNGYRCYAFGTTLNDKCDAWNFVKSCLYRCLKDPFCHGVQKTLTSENGKDYYYLIKRNALHVGCEAPNVIIEEKDLCYEGFEPPGKCVDDKDCNQGVCRRQKCVCFCGFGDDYCQRPTFEVATQRGKCHNPLDGDVCPKKRLLDCLKICSEKPYCIAVQQDLSRDEGKYHLIWNEAIRDQTCDLLILFLKPCCGHPNPTLPPLTTTTTTEAPITVTNLPTSKPTRRTTKTPAPTQTPTEPSTQGPPTRPPRPRENGTYLCPCKCQNRGRFYRGYTEDGCICEANTCGLNCAGRNYGKYPFYYLKALPLKTIQDVSDIQCIKQCLGEDRSVDQRDRLDEHDGGDNGDGYEDGHGSGEGVGDEDTGEDGDLGAPPEHYSGHTESFVSPYGRRKRKECKSVDYNPVTRECHFKGYSVYDRHVDLVDSSHLMPTKYLYHLEKCRGHPKFEICRNEPKILRNCFKSTDDQSCGRGRCIAVRTDGSGYCACPCGKHGSDCSESNVLSHPKACIWGTEWIRRKKNVLSHEACVDQCVDYGHRKCHSVDFSERKGSCHFNSKARNSRNILTINCRWFGLSYDYHEPQCSPVGAPALQRRCPCGRSGDSCELHNYAIERGVCLKKGQKKKIRGFVSLKECLDHCIDQWPRCRSIDYCEGSSLCYLNLYTDNQDNSNYLTTDCPSCSGIFNYYELRCPCADASSSSKTTCGIRGQPLPPLKCRTKYRFTRFAGAYIHNYHLYATKNLNLDQCMDLCATKYRGDCKGISYGKTKRYCYLKKHYIEPWNMKTYRLWGSSWDHYDMAVVCQGCDDRLSRSSGGYDDGYETLDNDDETDEPSGPGTSSEVGLNDYY